MKLRIGTFNVENLFSRPKAMNFPKWSEGQPILDDYHALNTLFNKDSYSESDKSEILTLLSKYDLTSSRPKDEFLELREIRGDLLHRFKDKNKPPIVKLKRETPIRRILTEVICRFNSLEAIQDQVEGTIPLYLIWPASNTARSQSTILFGRHNLKSWESISP